MILQRMEMQKGKGDPPVESRGSGCPSLGFLNS